VNPFLLLVVITVATPASGVGVATERLYMPSEVVCETVKNQLRREHNWVRQKRDDRGKISSTLVYSITKASCIPWGMEGLPQ